MPPMPPIPSMPSMPPMPPTPPMALRRQQQQERRARGVDKRCVFHDSRKRHEHEHAQRCARSPDHEAGPAAPRQGHRKCGHAHHEDGTEQYIVAQEAAVVEQHRRGDQQRSKPKPVAAGNQRQRRCQHDQRGNRDERPRHRNRITKDRKQRPACEHQRGTVQNGQMRVAAAFGEDIRVIREHAFVVHHGPIAEHDQTHEQGHGHEDRCDPGPEMEGTPAAVHGAPELARMPKPATRRRAASPAARR